MTEALALTLAYLVDLIMGDPRWLPHPVRVMGLFIEKLEAALRGLIAPNNIGMDKRLSTGAREKIAGAALVAVMIAGTFVSFYLLKKILFGFAPGYISSGVYVFLVSTTLATSGLLSAASGVIRELGRGEIDISRERLSMIVGRDTQDLREDGILQATIETLSENASDGITAPLFYFVLGGLPLAMTYKAVNTLDSMIGYKNEKYRNFGWAAARLDDIANYIPARITGVLIVASVYFINLCRYVVRQGTEVFEGAKTAFAIMIRDGKNHSSPNSGIPEAAMAGALGVRLGGTSTYEGVEVVKPYIGDNILKKGLRPGSVEAYMEAAMSAVLIIKMTSFFGFLAAISVLSAWRP